MADNDQVATGTGPEAAQADKQLVFQKVYLRDCSFESPNSPAVFTTAWEPNVNLNLTTQNKELGGDLYEVTLNITLDAKVQDKTAFLCEIQQAGVFHIKGFDEAEHKRLLGGYCPGIVFPYAREAISDLVAKGGFPQLLLQPVNFDALYVKQSQEMEKASAEAAQDPDRH